MQIPPFGRNDTEYVRYFLELVAVYWQLRAEN